MVCFLHLYVELILSSICKVFFFVNYVSFRAGLRFLAPLGSSGVLWCDFEVICEGPFCFRSQQLAFEVLLMAVHEWLLPFDSPFP